MKTKIKTTVYIVHGIATAMLLLTAQISLAGSATWLLSPQDQAWENANNWTPGGPPNGASDIATFAQSSQRYPNISTSVELNSITFTSNSASFRLSIPPSYSGSAQLIISGTGVQNNSSVLQTFYMGGGGPGEQGQIIFNNTSTAAGAQMHIVNFDGYTGPLSDGSGTTVFNDTSSASGVSIHNRGSTYAAASGQTIFNDTSTAGHASISNGGAGASSNPGNPGGTAFNGASTAANASIGNQASEGGGNGGYTIFNDKSTAGHATITTQGGIYQAESFGGATIFKGSSTAESAILIANGSLRRCAAVPLFLMMLRLAAPREWKFLTMVT